MQQTHKNTNTAAIYKSVSLYNITKVIEILHFYINKGSKIHSNVKFKTE